LIGLAPGEKERERGRERECVEKEDKKQIVKKERKK
jgi:hypothetical protein